jgi:hypothetical protein
MVMSAYPSSNIGQSPDRVVIRYRTHCVDGDFHARELSIEGDFRELHQSVLKHWGDYGFKTLADLARIDEIQ